MTTLSGIDFSTYCPEQGRTYLHKDKHGLWAYVTRAELYAAYRHIPDPERVQE